MSKDALQPPYPRLAYESECGFQLAVMEGYEFDTHKNSNATQTFSTRSNRIAEPKGNCMKCGESITVWPRDGYT